MSRYDTDTVLWSARQADLLRRLAAGERVNDQVDWENVAEEIDSVGRSERLALASHVGVVLEHLLKLAASPAIELRRGWEEGVRRGRLAIRRLLDDSPSLRPSLDSVIVRELPDARELVAASLARYGEAPRVALDALQYDADALLHADAVRAELLRRQQDGTWPDDPTPLGQEDDVTLESIGFSAPLAAFYRTAG